jgi:hypothetical protein
MTRNGNGKPSRLGGRGKNGTRDRNVGYGRPPRAHQFKPGQSGNPKGRPKGAKNESTILRDVLHRKIEIRDRGGRVRKIMTLEGIILRMADDSLKGNIRSAGFLLNRYGALVSGETDLQSLSEDDRQVLEAYVRSIQAERNDRG